LRTDPRMTAQQREQSFSCTYLAGTLGQAQTLAQAVEI